MDGSGLRLLSQNYYQKDIIGYQNLLRSYLEDKFSSLSKEAVDGKTKTTIYNLYYQPFSDCRVWYASIKARYTSPNVEDYYSLRYHFPSLDMGDFRKIAMDLALQLNEEKNYGLTINDICPGWKNQTEIVASWE